MSSVMQLYVAVFFILFNIQMQRASCSLLSEIDQTLLSRNSFQRCFDKIGELFFHSKKEIIIAVTDQTKYLFDFAKYVFDFKYKSNWTFYTSNIFYINKIPRCYDKNYILEIQDLEDLVKAFQLMRSSNCWNQNQYIYIYSSTILENSMFRNMVNYVNQQYLINVIIISPRKEQVLSFNAYKMISKKNEKCAVMPRFPEIFTCKLGNITTPMIYNYNQNSKCLWKIKAIVWPPFVIVSNHSSDIVNGRSVEKNSVRGFEVELMNLISESLRIEVEYYPSLTEDWGRSYFNGTTTKTMQDLTMKKIDVAIGSFTTSSSRTLLFRSSISYSEENIVCCVASNRYVDVWSTLINTFQLFLSISIVYLMMATIIWVISRHYDENHRRYRKASTCYLYCFAMLVGVSVKVLPKTKNARMFVILLLIFEFFYVAFYESILTSVLLSPNWNEDIKTYKDIIDRNMNIYNEPENRRYFENMESKLGEKIMSLWIDCFNVTSCLEDVKQDRNKAICLGKMHKDYVTSNENWRGKPSLSCIQHAVMTYPVVMIMRRSLPYHHKINSLIRRCLSAGLVDKWISSSFYKRNNRYVKQKDFSGNLEFRNLKPVFVVFIIGHLIASAVAVVEIVYYNFDRFSGLTVMCWVLKLLRVSNNRLE